MRTSIQAVPNPGTSLTSPYQRGNSVIKSGDLSGRGNYPSGRVDRASGAAERSSKEDSGGRKFEGEGGMDRESESPLIRAIGLSGHGITAFARAHAREGGEGGLGQCETRICSSKRAASRSACKLPSSFCAPVLYPFTSVRGQRWRLRRMHPGPEIKSRPVSMLESLPTAKIVGFQELHSGHSSILKIARLGLGSNRNLYGGTVLSPTKIRIG